MKLLEGKTALIFGLANERSIAWGITKAFHEHGATLGLSYAGEVLERRVNPLAKSIGCTFVESCDVSRDEQIQKVAQRAADVFGQVDILVHSIGFADREELKGPYYNTFIWRWISACFPSPPWRKLFNPFYDRVAHC